MVFDAFVALLDVAATSLNMAGVKPPPSCLVEVLCLQQTGRNGMTSASNYHRIVGERVACDFHQDERLLTDIEAKS